LALFLFCGLYVFSGTQVMTPEIGQIRSGSPAEKAGMLKEDVILSVQGKPIESWSEIKDRIQDHAGQTLLISVQRGDAVLDLTIIPEEAMVKNIFGEDVKSGLIGIVASGKFKKIELGPWEAVQEAFLRTGELIGLTCLTIVKLFQGIVSIKTLGGPILIGQMTGQLAQESFSYLIPLLAVISVNLGVLNLLPVPILDGGVIIFLLMELFLRKPISFKKRDLAQKAGLFVLALLIVVVTINDLSRIEFFRKLFERFFG
jgi:regulator of sigma E protease